jgi:hypothetical protein
MAVPSIAPDNAAPEIGLSRNNRNLPALTPEEQGAVSTALDALYALKKTFDYWIDIARALKLLRDKADRIGGRFTFDLLRQREGLGGKDHLGREILNKTRVSRLLAILDRLEEVQQWRARLSDGQRFAWSSAEAVHQHCPLFQKPDDEDEEPAQKAARSTTAKLIEALEALDAESTKNRTLLAMRGEAAQPPGVRVEILIDLFSDYYTPSVLRRLAKGLLDRAEADERQAEIEATDGKARLH